MTATPLVAATTDAGKRKYVQHNYYRTLDGKASAGSISGRRGIIEYFFGDVLAGGGTNGVPSVPRSRKEHKRKVIIGGPETTVRQYSGDQLLLPQIPTQRARGGKPCTITDLGTGDEWTVYIHGGRQAFVSALGSTLRPVRSLMIQMGTSKPVGPFGPAAQAKP